MTFTLQTGYAPRTLDERRAYLRLIGAYDCRYATGPNWLAHHIWGMSDLDINRLFLCAVPVVNKDEEGAHEMLHGLRVLTHVHPHFTKMLQAIARKAKEAGAGKKKEEEHGIR